MASLTTLLRLVACRKGNFSITTALVAAPLLGAAALATDYSRAYQSRTALQNAVDSATMSAALSEERDISKLKETVANFVSSNYGDEYRLIDVSLAPLPNGGEKLEVTAETGVKTMLGALIGTDKLNARVAAAVQRNFRPAWFTFKPVSAKGWYTKEFYVVTRDANGNILRDELVMTYENDYPRDRGTTRSYYQSKRYELGEYDRWQIRMRVWRTGTKYGSRRKQDYAALDYYSTDKDARIDNPVVTCGKQNHHAWEDGGGGTPDFQYIIECGTGDRPQTAYFLK